MGGAGTSQPRPQGGPSPAPPLRLLWETNQAFAKDSPGSDAEPLPTAVSSLAKMRGRASAAAAAIQAAGPGGTRESRGGEGIGGGVGGGVGGPRRSTDSSVTAEGAVVGTGASQAQVQDYAEGQLRPPLGALHAYEGYGAGSAWSEAEPVPPPRGPEPQGYGAGAEWSEAEPVPPPLGPEPRGLLALLPVRSEGGVRLGSGNDDDGAAAVNDTNGDDGGGDAAPGQRYSHDGLGSGIMPLAAGQLVIGSGADRRDVVTLGLERERSQEELLPMPPLAHGGALAATAPFGPGVSAGVNPLAEVGAGGEGEGEQGLGARAAGRATPQRPSFHKSFTHEIRHVTFREWEASDATATEGGAGPAGEGSGSEGGAGAGTAAGAEYGRSLSASAAAAAAAVAANDAEGSHSLPSTPTPTPALNPGVQGALLASPSTPGSGATLQVRERGRVGTGGEGE